LGQAKCLQTSPALSCRSQNGSTKRSCLFLLLPYFSWSCRSMVLLYDVPLLLGFLILNPLFFYIITVYLLITNAHPQYLLPLLYCFFICFLYIEIYPYFLLFSSFVCNNNENGFTKGNQGGIRGLIFFYTIKGRTTKSMLNSLFSKRYHPNLIHLEKSNCISRYAN
jgi:hypothetical protein